MLCVDFKKWQCRMSLSLKTPHVPCRIKEMTMSHVTMTLIPCRVTKAPCHMSNLKNGRVTVSISGVKGHIYCTLSGHSFISLQSRNTLAICYRTLFVNHILSIRCVHK